MSKICTNCGQQFSDKVELCPRCAIPLHPAQAPSAAPAPVAAPEVAEAAAPAIADKKLGTASIIAIILIILIPVCVALYAMWDVFVPAYDDPLNDMVMIFNGHTEKYADTMPDAYYDFMKKEHKQSKEALTDTALLSSSIDSVRALLSTTYGEDVEFSADVTGKSELGSKKLKLIKEGLKANYDISKSSVTRAMKVKFNFTIEGKKGNQTVKSEMLVAKIDGEWFAVTEFGTLSNDVLTLLGSLSAAK